MIGFLLNPDPPENTDIFSLCLDILGSLNLSEEVKIAIARDLLNTLLI